MSKLDGMPELLTRAQVLAVTGWSKDVYYAVVKGDGLRTVRVPGGKQRRVLKASLARLIKG